ncbi:hypothetical protein SRB17_77500 [Streptomyces sp. RB17]|nr:hypothetical protein [Streptomyces sp. RB17]
MRGIGPLPAARLQQSQPPQAFQEQLQRLLLQPMLDQAGPEQAQNTGIEPGIIQLKAEEELPVHAGPHLISSLPVGQPLRVLHHRHQGQRPGRDGRTPQPGKRLGKRLILKQRPQLLPDPHRERPLGERCAYHPDRLRRAEHRPPVADLRHADQFLGGELRTEQAHALQAERVGELPHQGRLSDAGGVPAEHGPDGGEAEEEFGDADGSDGDGGLQRWASLRGFEGRSGTTRTVWAYGGAGAAGFQAARSSSVPSVPSVPESLVPESPVSGTWGPFSSPSQRRST